MKKLILTAGICISSLLCVQAQTAASNVVSSRTNQKVEKMITKMKNTCNLTPDQVEKVRPIITEAVNAKVANKKQYATDKVKLKAANQETNKIKTAKLASVLNATQQAKWSAVTGHKKPSAPATSK